MNIALKRTSWDSYGTFGQLLAEDGSLLCYTVELPWASNAPDKSCIPAGIYPCTPHNSIAHPNTWEVSNVPNRSEILIHNANFPDQLLGCIGVGDNIATIAGHLGVTNSVATLAKLRLLLPSSFTLTVANPWGIMPSEVGKISV